MKVRGRTERLLAGVALTAKIKTGSRRILEFLLPGLRQYAQGAIRDR